jgi:methylated-DNA-[protein]-cysteine S-methyltransferase
MAWFDLPTPVGPLRLRGDGGVLRSISFSASRSFPATDGRPSRVPFRDAIAQLDEYFAGRRRRFELEIRPEGTPFQKEVWDLLQTIPYGETSSYGELARQLGRPDASRAVGAANGRNPIPIVIPCHRVIGSDGSLTGFGGGLPTKRRLLAFEAARREAGPGRNLTLFEDPWTIAAAPSR